jgi:hypothetical protein
MRGGIGYLNTGIGSHDRGPEGRGGVRKLMLTMGRVAAHRDLLRWRDPASPGGGVAYTVKYSGQQ